jgi:chromosomal replication initiation ATPase DnaA
MIMNPYVIPGIKLSIDDYYSALLDRIGITDEQIKGKCRLHYIVAARSVIAKSIRKRYKTMTTTKIGKMINRDHSTVIHYCNRQCNSVELERLENLIKDL